MSKWHRTTLVDAPGDTWPCPHCGHALISFDRVMARLGRMPAVGTKGMCAQCETVLFITGHNAARIATPIELEMIPRDEMEEMRSGVIAARALRKEQPS